MAAAAPVGFAVGFDVLVAGTVGVGIVATKVGLLETEVGVVAGACGTIEPGLIDPGLIEPGAWVEEGDDCGMIEPEVRVVRGTFGTMEPAVGELPATIGVKSLSDPVESSSDPVESSSDPVLSSSEPLDWVPEPDVLPDPVVPEPELVLSSLTDSVGSSSLDPDDCSKVEPVGTSSTELELELVLDQELKSSS